MKLRNKKTGEAVYVDFQIPLCNNDEILGSYSVTSLEELNKKFEDYKPKEPLIKDEKIRKAVRAWAEANNRDLFRVINEHFNCCKIIGYTDEGNTSCNKIEFGTTIAGADKNYYYTIDELCGEDEE